MSLHPTPGRGSLLDGTAHAGRENRIFARYLLETG